MYVPYPWSHPFIILTCSSLQTHNLSPVHSEVTQVPTSAAPSQKQVWADTAPSPPALHLAPQLQARTPKHSSRAPSRHLLDHMVYPPTPKRLRSSNFPPPTSHTPTPCQRSARNTSPAMPPIRLTPLKSQPQASHQRTPPRQWSAADPAMPP